MLLRMPMLVAFFLLASCGRKLDSGTTPGGPMAARVDSIFLAQLRPDGPGCAVGVYRNGKSELARGYGVTNLEDPHPITEHTTFDLGSVAKQFTALAVLQLEEQGKLSLTDDIRRFVPEMPVYPTPIRIRDLLFHTSGLRDYGDLESIIARPINTMATLLDVVSRQQTLNFPAGTKHEYSHSDYELLGLIVERASGEPFGRHLEEKVLKPLGMTDSRVTDARAPLVPNRAFGYEKVGDAWQVQFPEGGVIGGGNLYTSVADMAHWNQALADGASGKNGLIARMLVLPTLPNGDTVPYAWGIRRGSYRGLPMLTRGGHTHGILTEMVRFPAKDFGLTVFCNQGELLPGLPSRVADLYLDKEMKARQPSFPAPPAEVKPQPGELERFVGWYGDLENIARFTIVDGKLTELLGDTVQTWTYRGDGLFTGDGSPTDFRIKFSAADSGPARFDMSWRGETRESAVRIPESAQWHPTSSELAAYAGTWVNAELDLVWRLVVRGGQLMLERPGAPDASLLPHKRDRFSTRFGPWDEQLEVGFAFGRGSGRSVNGFVVSTSGEPAVRDLRFVRVPPP